MKKAMQIRCVVFTRLVWQQQKRMRMQEKTVQNFIHAESEKEIIFTRNTTESLNLIAYSYALHHLKAGDEIVVSIMEHHSNMLPWQMVAKMTGAVIRYLEFPKYTEKASGEKDIYFSDEILQECINEKTKLVAVCQVSNVLGCVNPIRKMAKLAHAAGAVIVVDAAQSAPHMPIDVKSWMPISLHFPDTNCWDQWESACCMESRNYWKKCRHL